MEGPVPAFVARLTGMPQEDLYIAFAEWDGRVPREASLYVRKPGTCLVCGAPGNSCRGDEHMAVKKKVVKKPVRQAVTEEEIPTPEHLTQENPDEEPIVDPDEPETPDVDDAPDSPDEDDEDDDTEADEPADEGFVQEHFGGMPKDGIVIGEGKPVHVKGVLIGNEIHLTVPTYRALVPYRSMRYTFTIVHDKGAVVHKDNVGSFEQVN